MIVTELLLKRLTRMYRLVIKMYIKSMKTIPQNQTANNENVRNTFKFIKSISNVLCFIFPMILYFIYMHITHSHSPSYVYQQSCLITCISRYYSLVATCQVCPTRLLDAFRNTFPKCYCRTHKLGQSHKLGQFHKPGQFYPTLWD